MFLVTLPVAFRRLETPKTRLVVMTCSSNTHHEPRRGDGRATTTRMRGSERLWRPGDRRRGQMRRRGCCRQRISGRDRRACPVRRSPCLYLLLGTLEEEKKKGKKLTRRTAVAHSSALLLSANEALSNFFSSKKILYEPSLIRCFIIIRAGFGLVATYFRIATPV